MPAQHQITHVCDDIRAETGNKLSLMGLYDNGVVVERTPARLAKLCLFQRWTDAKDIQKLRVELRGEALAGVYTIQGEVEQDGGGYRKVQLSLVFSPVEFQATGSFEFATYINDEAQPSHVHEMELRQKSPAPTVP
jgi:hypothetical protein